MLSLQDKTLKRLVYKRGEWQNHVPDYWRPILFIPCNFAGNCFSSEGIMQLSGESCPLKPGVLFRNQAKFKLIRVRSGGGGGQGVSDNAAFQSTCCQLLPKAQICPCASGRRCLPPPPVRAGGGPQLTAVHCMYR